MEALDIIVGKNVLREGTDFPSPREIKILENTREEGYVGERDYFLTQLILHAGLRVHECANLDTANVHIHQKYLTLPDRTVRFGNTLQTLMKPLKTGPVFRSEHGKRLTVRALQKSVKRQLQLTNLDHYSARSLRHAYALRLYRASGHDLDVVHEQLGAQGLYFRPTGNLITRIKESVERL